MKKLLSITVRGKNREWSFTTLQDPQYLDEWRADGLIVDEVVNTGPLWISGTCLVKPWIFVQDIFNFNNPFK